MHSYYLYFGYANILLRKMEKVPRNSGRNPTIPSSSILSIIAGSLIIIGGFLIPLTKSEGKLKEILGHDKAESLMKKITRTTKSKSKLTSDK